MNNSQRFNFVESFDSFGVPDDLPLLPISLKYHDKVLETQALLDTGASVNVLPYRLGIELGAVWEEQTMSVTLAGNLANFEAKGLILFGEISDFKTVRLVFAWSSSNDVPVLLGRMNFFLEFDVCFYRSQLAFEVKPRS